MKEPLVELVEIKEFLVATEAEGLMKDPDWAKFVHEDVGPQMSKRLAKERSYNENYLAAVAHLMEALIVIFISELRIKRYNENFIAGMTFLFQPDCMVHKAHYQISQETLKKLRTANQTWRNEMKVGDGLDILVKADEKGIISGFMQAKITRIEGDTLFVEYPDSSNFYDGQIDRWATEICPFESKTKEDYAWRKENLENAKDLEVDAHDKSTWLRATIFETKDQTISNSRVIKLAYVAFRIYRTKANQVRKDERGTFEGWSQKFDEWVPIYSPRIFPWATRYGITNVEDDDLDEDLDDLVEPEAGMQKVYAVPRIFKCISGQFLHFMNLFGNEGGFDMVIDVLENANLDNDLTISVMGCLAQIVTLPSTVLHRDFIKQYGQRIADAIKSRLLNASDKSLRDVRKDQLDSILKSVENVSRRFLSKDERDKQSEILKLEMCNKCLNSEFLERRINAIKDLNQIIRNNTLLMNSKVFSTEFLIDWMKKHEVFTTIWDTTKTHIQLIQRSNEIFKLLCKEDLMTDDLLTLFWSLSSTHAYKAEIFKIINEASFHLKNKHIEFFFNQITATSADKLSMEEFNCLSELGKYCKNSEFMQKVSDFFWKIITEATNHTDELIENCIKKFTEMVQYWTIEQKRPLLEALTNQLNITEHPALPVIRLFKKMIKDQKERVSYTSVATTSTYNTSYVSTYPVKSESTIAPHESIYDCGADTGCADSTSTTVATYSQNEPQNDISEQINTSTDPIIKEKELTFEQVLNQLQKDKNLVGILLHNLESYSNRVITKLTAEPALAKSERTKLFIQTKSASHADEISERLQFLNYYASVSDFIVSKVELKVIYDLLARSPVKTDLTEFLIWCKQACETSTNSKSILNLEEVGEFYSELITKGMLDVKTLPMVGFDFLQHYIISVNENQSKLLRIKKEKAKVQTNYSQGNAWKSYFLQKNTEEVAVREENDDPNFRIVINPSKLEKIDMIWTVVLNSENDEVIPKAVNFLIKTYLCLDECLSEDAAQIQQDLIEKCMVLIRNENTSPKIVKRVLYILKNIIKESEKRGTGGVQPHNAILKGELLDRIIIKNYTMTKGQNIVVSVYTSATVWDFVSEVSKMFWLSPKHVEFRLPNNKKIDETMHGMVLKELHIKQGDVITARKITVDEDIPTGDLVDPNTKHFTPVAQTIFEEWWEVYKEEGTNDFTPLSAVRFIKGCTHEEIGQEDSRIVGLFNIYDKDKIGKMSRQQFMDFFLRASTDRPERVHENLKCHHIRPDLQKIYQVKEDCEFTKEQMPRYTLSANQSYFNLLMEILEKNKEAQADAWDLICMLQTNQEMYREVLTLKNAKDTETGMIQWEKFFDNSSVYKQIYNLEIIEAVMKEGEKQGQLGDENNSDNRVFFVEYQDTGSKKNKAGWLPPQLKDQAEFKKEQSVEADLRAQYVLMKNNWTKQFVEQNGISFVLNRLLSQEIGKDSNAISRSFELKNTSFMLTLLRVFIVAAIAAQPNQDTSGSMQLLRRKSSIRGDVDELKPDESEKQEESHSQLIELLKEHAGLELLLSIDFHALQKQLMNMVSQIIGNDSATSEEKQIVENAMSLWIGIVGYKPELFTDFETFKTDEKIKNADDFVMYGLLYCKENKIREDFKTAFSVVSHNIKTEGSLSFLIKILSENFSKISDFPCVQFFDLYNELIDLFYARQALSEIDEKSQNIFNPEIVLSFIIDKIRSEKKSGNASKEAEEDDIFAKEKADLNEKFRIGLIQLLGKIITKVDAHLSEKIVQEKDLIQEIFKEFLFASVFAAQENGAGVVKLSEKKKKKAAATTSSNNKSREAAYSLLLSLIKKSPILMGRFINEQLMPLLQMINKPNKWNYQPPGQSSTLQKYVGLKNLGCICYMNSMMQQFFMTPALRYNLLCVDDSICTKMVEYKGDSFDDNMLHQIQRLIAHLELSERQDYNPKGFCFSFKEFDGQPTNISEQKDAQEFLNVLFDRLDNALKPTTRKYLLFNIFGGKQCNQMVCQECGKVKNRIEDFYNLSLTVKDIKSLYESLQKQLEGEIINDYHCDQCNRKVNLSKRTLIAETPNILIVHLQRLVFNFDTFRNDKINSLFKFPAVLDLKPYSYYEVMNKEGRLPTKKEEGASEEEDDSEVKKEDEEFIQPIQDDCFEYKLVGVNIHSGSANAGHYWSYINTNRDSDEGNDDPNWIKTENDPWMEFNDSRVSDFQYSKLEEESFGEEATNNYTSAWSFGGGAYGKSGYMLFYERRKKKDLKILVPQAKVEEVKAQGVTVHHDEKTKEFYKLVGYREGAENETPSEIYQKVFEDNKSVTFENDIYSQEFFDFIKQILDQVASYADQSDATHELNVISMNVAKKVTIDILSRCFSNGGMKFMVQIMIDIFKKDDRLCKKFLESILQENNAECILEILFDCTDKVAQVNVARLMKYLLCRLKIIEKDDLLSAATETICETIIENGKEVIQEHQLPKSISAKFMNILFYHLQGRAAKSWSRFEYYLDILKAFALNSPEDLEKEQDTETLIMESEGCRIGMEYYFKNNYLERLLDFVLGDSSPIKQPGEKRIQMGSSFISANFSSIIKLITAMMTDKELLLKYPMTDATKLMISSKDMLSKMMEPSVGQSDSSQEVILMCKGNFNLSKKVAKLLIKGINQYQVDKVTKYLKLLKRFLSIDDDFKTARLEWSLGVPQIVNKKQFRKNNYQYGLELIDKINDEAHTFNTTLTTGTSEDALLTQLLKIRKQQETICMVALKCLLKLCVNDDVIARYVYRCQAPSYQGARYIDWIRGYFNSHRCDLEKATSGVTTSYSQYYEGRFKTLEKAEAVLIKFEDICKKFADEEKAQFESLSETSFVGLRDTWMGYEHPEVIPHFPPQIIVGKQIGEDKVLMTEENESVIVRLVEIECEWMYSNPTGLFNLSVPDRALRLPNYQVATYEQFKNSFKKQEEPAEQSGEGAEQPEGNQVEEKPEQFVVKDWINDHKTGYVILKVVCASKLSSMFAVSVKVIVEDNENKNVSIPANGFKDNIFSGDEKSIGHIVKIDPSKENWGDFRLDVVVKKKFSSNQISNTGNYGYGGNTYGNNAYATSTTSYSNVGYNTVGVSTATETESIYEPAGSAAVEPYVPSGGVKASNDDVKIACVSCGHLCDIGQTFCAKCGEACCSDSVYDDVDHTNYFQP